MAVEPGANGHDVDAAARAVIEDAGYGDQFTTGTGHGVGIRCHELPSISPGADAELETGAVFSVEPGIYFEGEWGVRLETVVALTEDGPESLNQSPYTWNRSERATDRRDASRGQTRPPTIMSVAVFLPNVP